MHVSKPVIMVGRILIVEPAFEEEARSRHMCYDPLCLPLWVCVPMNGRSAQEQVWVLLVSLLQARYEGRMNVRISREGRKIAER